MVWRGEKRTEHGRCEVIFGLWLSKLSEIEISENSSSMKSLSPGNSHWEWNSYEFKSKLHIKVVLSKGGLERPKNRERLSNNLCP